MTMLATVRSLDFVKRRYRQLAFRGLWRRVTDL